MLFRHMVFNASIGNVDDHLKNFWMLGASSGYRLAPAFDLLTRRCLEPTDCLDYLIDALRARFVRSVRFVRNAPDSRRGS